MLTSARHWNQGGVAGNRILVVNFDRDEKRMREIHDGVRDSKSLKGAIGLLTLSADPADMPAVLRAFADSVQADPEVWRFAALPVGDAAATLQQFGAAADRTVVAIVDAEGNVVKLSGADSWTSAEIVRDLESLVLRADPAVIDAYVAAQEALARDDAAATRSALSRLRRAVREPAVGRLASTAASGRDLVAIRAAFKPLSEAFVRLPWPRQYQPMYCPMYDDNAGATWVQRAGPAINPYFGKAMLRCGTDLSTGAHRDHSPLFGGILFMAADQFHHVEGTYTDDGVLRVRIYDNFKKQISARGFKATARVSDRDPTLKLAAAADGLTLDARIGRVPFPAEVTVMMTLDRRGPEERFDFVFADYSAATAKR